MRGSTDKKQGRACTRKAGDLQSEKGAEARLAASVIMCSSILYLFCSIMYPCMECRSPLGIFRAVDGNLGSQWCGFKHFDRFFSSSQFWPLIKNTLGLSFLQILLGFPIPVLLAIMLNQVKHQRFRKFVQSIVYCPHFISIVVLTGMLYIFLSPRNGLINQVIQLFWR